MFWHDCNALSVLVQVAWQLLSTLGTLVQFPVLKTRMVARLPRAMDSGRAGSVFRAYGAWLYVKGLQA